MSLSPTSRACSEVGTIRHSDCSTFIWNEVRSRIRTTYPGHPRMNSMAIPKTIAFRPREEQDVRIRAYTKDAGISLTDAMREAVDYWIDRRSGDSARLSPANGPRKQPLDTQLPSAMSSFPTSPPIDAPRESPSAPPHSPVEQSSDITTHDRLQPVNAPIKQPPTGSTPSTGQPTGWDAPRSPTPTTRSVLQSPGGPGSMTPSARQEQAPLPATAPRPPNIPRRVLPLTEPHRGTNGVHLDRIVRLRRKDGTRCYALVCLGPRQA